MARLSDPGPLSEEAQREFERVRSEHRLRPLTGEESGSGVNRLPGGVFGFTYSPAEDNFPLFNDRDVRSFETHKLEDGSVLLLGFLTREEREAFERGDRGVTIHLFSEPQGAAGELVRVPMSRVESHVENSTRKGTGLELRLRPSPR